MSDSPLPPASTLLSWYREARRDLPWRRTRDPYRIWVSEVMLQQTRVEAVTDHYERFLARFPDLAGLARASEEEVLSIWSGLGYYRRARLLREGAIRVVEEHGGSFPRQIDDALRLPGVGPYTAAAILSIAFGKPHAVVDGNVERVLTRLLALGGNPRRAPLAARLREIARRWLPARRPGDFNQAVMELGATICRPRSPGCPRCPLAAACRARAEGDPERYPELPAPRSAVRVRVELGLLRRGDRYLLERGTSLPFLRGLWGFPLAVGPEGSREAPPEPDIATRLSGRLGVEVLRTGDDPPPLRHAITYRRITLQPRRLRAGRFRLPGRREFRWAALAELGRQIAVSSMSLKVARTLARG